MMNEIDNIFNSFNKLFYMTGEQGGEARAALGYYTDEINQALTDLEEFGLEEFQNTYQTIGDALLRIRAEAERFGLKDVLNQCVIEHKQATDLWNEMSSDTSSITPEKIKTAVTMYRELTKDLKSKM